MKGGCRDARWGAGAAAALGRPQPRGEISADQDSPAATEALIYSRETTNGEGIRHGEKKEGKKSRHLPVPAPHEPHVSAFICPQLGAAGPGTSPPARRRRSAARCGGRGNGAPTTS